WTPRATWRGRSSRRASSDSRARSTRTAASRSIRTNLAASTSSTVTGDKGPLLTTPSPASGSSRPRTRTRGRGPSLGSSRGDDPGAREVGVAAEERMLRRHGLAQRLVERDEVVHGAEVGSEPGHEAHEVEEDDLERRVAGALALSQEAAVDRPAARADRGERV